MPELFEPEKKTFAGASTVEACFQWLHAERLGFTHGEVSHQQRNEKKSRRHVGDVERPF
jgi:hypothetical protein